LFPSLYLSYIYTMHEQHLRLEEILASFEQPDNEVLQQSVQRWLTEDPENRTYYEEVKRIWFTGNEPGDMEYDIEKEKEKFWNRIDGPELTAPVRPIRRLWKIAAAAIIIIGAGFAIWKYTRPVDAYMVLQTARGERDSVILADGSKVVLNGNSKVAYRTVMNGATREVWLEKGEAFFEVAKNPKRPFIVHADSANVQVVGTSFDVRITTQQIAVAVATGKVNFSPLHITDKAFLLPGLTGVWTKSDTKVVVTENSNMLAWRTGKLKFNDASLKEVLSALGYMHNIEVDMLPSLKSTRLTATIDNISLEKMILLLESSLDIRITKVDSVTYKAQPLR
jgi:transmembrane sensor